MKGNFVMLRAGRLRLVLPQGDVGAASYIEPGDAAECLALSETMKLLPRRPAERFVAAEFTGEYAGAPWCWDELRVLIDVAFDPLPLPQALRGDGAPVHAYVQVDGELAFVSSAESICRYAPAEQV
jgi:hypothetical protein